MKTRSFTVVDDAHTAMGETLQEMCNQVDKAITEYISILNQITAEAAKAGITTARYKGYANAISGLKEQFVMLGNALNSAATEFVYEINSADSYLY